MKRYKLFGFNNPQETPEESDLLGYYDELIEVYRTLDCTVLLFDNYEVYDSLTNARIFTLYKKDL